MLAEDYRYLNMIAFEELKGWWRDYHPLELLRPKYLTAQNHSISDVAKFENDDAESISYKVTSNGEIQQVDFEGPV